MSSKKTTTKFTFLEMKKESEPTRIEETKAIDLDRIINESDDYESMSSDVLEYKLEFEENDKEIIKKIKAVLKARGR